MAISFDQKSSHKKSLTKSLLLAVFVISLVSVIVYSLQNGSFDTRGRAAGYDRKCDKNGAQCCLTGSNNNYCTRWGICKGGRCMVQSQNNPTPTPIAQPIAQPAGQVIAQWDFTPPCSIEQSIWQFILPDGSIRSVGSCNNKDFPPSSVLVATFTTWGHNKPEYVKINPRPDFLRFHGNVNSILTDGGSYVFEAYMREGKVHPDQDSVNPLELDVKLSNKPSFRLSKTIPIADSNSTLFTLVSFPPFEVETSQTTLEYVNLTMSNLNSSQIVGITFDTIRLVQQ